MFSIYRFITQIFSAKIKKNTPENNGKTRVSNQKAMMRSSTVVTAFTTIEMKRSTRKFKGERLSEKIIINNFILRILAQFKITIQNFTKSTIL